MSEMNDNQEETRRGFLTGTLIAAGTAMAVSSGVASAEAAEPAASNPMPGRSLHVAVKQGIEAKAVHAALDRILELVGCPACGFNGILDVQINVVNPVAENFAQQGILGVSQNLGRF